MNGQRWRDMRSTLSPAFTGSKMRQMFELIVECSDEITNHLLKQAAAGDGKKIDVEIREIFYCYTNDVIASCAFGIRVNSLEDPNNEFSVMRKKMQNGFGVMQALRFLFILTLPKLAHKSNVHLTDSDVTEFFKSMVIGTMEERKKKGIFRPDMINILMQIRQGNSLDQDASTEESDIGEKAPQIPWTDNELVAQCLIFFIGGFGPTSLMLTFLTYELCINPDVQQKLYEEIVEVNENLEGKRITYDSLQKMQYLDQVVTGCLRKWPAAHLMDRVCVKEFECEYDDSVKFRFEKGMPLWIPIYALHHDSKYFTAPEQFDPERFSEENKRNIVPGSYVPFGFGPRNCIG